MSQIANNNGLGLDGAQLGAFDAFGDFLLERSRYVNLTSILDETGVVLKHFWDSLSLAVRVDRLAELYAAARMPRLTGGCGINPSHTPDGASNKKPPHAGLIDVGSGAGFPGIPLKILFGDALNVVMIDATRKKADFINGACDLLGYGREGAAAHHIRAEDAAKRPGFRGRFDFAAARALGALPAILEYCVPFLKPGGRLIAMKGRRASAENELALAAPAMARLGCGLQKVVNYHIGVEVAGEPHERTLIIIGKNK